MVQWSMQEKNNKIGRWRHGEGRVSQGQDRITGALSKDKLTLWVPEVKG